MAPGTQPTRSFTPAEVAAQYLEINGFKYNENNAFSATGNSLNWEGKLVERAFDYDGVDCECDVRLSLNKTLNGGRIEIGDLAPKNCLKTSHVTILDDVRIGETPEGVLYRADKKGKPVATTYTKPQEVTECRLDVLQALGIPIDKLQARAAIVFSAYEMARDQGSELLAEAQPLGELMKRSPEPLFSPQSEQRDGTIGNGISKKPSFDDIKQNIIIGSSSTGKTLIQELEPPQDSIRKLAIELAQADRNTWTRGETVTWMSTTGDERLLQTTATGRIKEMKTRTPGITHVGKVVSTYGDRRDSDSYITVEDTATGQQFKIQSKALKDVREGYNDLGD